MDQITVSNVTSPSPSITKSNHFKQQQKSQSVLTPPVSGVRPATKWTPTNGCSSQTATNMVSVHLDVANNQNSRMTSSDAAIDGTTQMINAASSTFTQQMAATVEPQQDPFIKIQTVPNNDLLDKTTADMVPNAYVDVDKVKPDEQF